MRTNRSGQAGPELPERRNTVPRAFEVVASVHDKSLDVALAGELDMAATFKLEPEIERLLGAHEVRRLVIDLAGLTFVDSAGLGALLSIHDRARDGGIDITLSNPSQPVRRILDLSGTDAVLLD
jgi:anti-sigma B factor antagonist